MPDFAWLTAANVPFQTPADCVVKTTRSAHYERSPGSEWRGLLEWVA